MDPFLQTRIFEEIDLTSQRLEEIAKITHTNAATCAFHTKLLIGIFLFIITGSLTLMYTGITTHILTPDKQSEIQVLHENTPRRHPIPDTSKGEQ